MRRLLLGLAILALCAGCVRRTGASGAAIENPYGDPGVYRDRVTSCEYLNVGHSTLTPRIAADGHTHMGCNSK